MPRVTFHRAYKGYKPGETGTITDLEMVRLLDRRDNKGRKVVSLFSRKDPKPPAEPVKSPVKTTPVEGETRETEVTETR